MTANESARRRSKIGLAPGSLVYVGPARSHTPRILVNDFDQAQLESNELKDPADCKRYLSRPTTSWIDVDGVHKAEIISGLGELLQLHPLTQEDLMSVRQRPKLEEHEGYLFIALKMVYRKDTELVFEQLGLILSRGCVFSFQEVPGDVFDAVRGRVGTAGTRVRRSGADYLAYALLDAVVDNYFPLLEGFGDQLEELEVELIENPTPATLQRVLDLKRTLARLRRSVWPLREVVAALERSESPLIEASTRPFLRDLYDHTIQVIDAIEGQREVLSEMVSIYLSSVSNQMNLGMRMLAVIATIFMPLSFVAGVYGMNFEWMPELKWQWGYPVIWCMLFGVATFLIVHFRRKGWL